MPTVDSSPCFPRSVLVMLYVLLLRGVASEESPNGTDVAVTSLDHFLSSALLLLRKAHAQTVSGK